MNDKEMLESEARYWNGVIAERNRIRGMANPDKRLNKEDLLDHRREIINKIESRRGRESAKRLLDEMQRLWPL